MIERICKCCQRSFGDTNPVETLHYETVCYSCRRPGVAKLCSQCSQPFKANKPETTICFGCWYSDCMKTADGEFAPLRAAFAAEGFESEVWQTGGMCMALAVCLEKDGDSYRRWMLVGDPDESGVGGSYEWNDEGDFVNVSTSETDPEKAAKLIAGWLREHGLDKAHNAKLVAGSDITLGSAS